MSIFKANDKRREGEMYKCIKQVRKLGLLSAIICVPCMSQAATAVMDTFDTDLGTWTENTGQTTAGICPERGLWSPWSATPFAGIQAVSSCDLTAGGWSSEGS